MNFLMLVCVLTGAFVWAVLVLLLVVLVVKKLNWG
jgi:hypothetical protein